MSRAAREGALPKPYYEQDGIVIYNADCRDVLPMLSGVDVVLTDPPYGTTDLTLDRDVGNMWPSLLLNCVSQYLVSTGPVELLAKISSLWTMRWSGAWIKDRAQMRTYNAKKPMSQCELYGVFSHPEQTINQLVFNRLEVPGAAYRRILRHSGYARNAEDQLDRANGSSWTKEGFLVDNHGTRLQTDVIFAPAKPNMVHVERTAHPTQKPLAFVSVFLHWLSNFGDLILDPFMGSGTTLVAAKQLGRRAIGIEIEERYCAIAVERLRQAVLPLLQPARAEQAALPLDGAPS